MQRNMAANCGMDCQAAGEFIASIVCPELKPIRASEASREQPNGTSDARQSAAWAGLPEQCREGESDTMQRSAKNGHSGAGHVGEAEHDRAHPRIILTAKLRLRQALPMLEWLLAGAHCDRSNEHGQEMSVHTCEHKQSGASNDCASNLRAALQFGKDETDTGSFPIGSACEKGLGCLTDEYFWQYLQSLLNEAQHCAYASKPELRPQQSL